MTPIATYQVVYRSITLDEALRLCPDIEFERIDSFAVVEWRFATNADRQRFNDAVEQHLNKKS